MRPNLFANTPDILHEYLQRGGRPAFQARLVLAATLGASYGIYSGFELCENVPVRAGSEEYLDSEKYQIRPRDFERADSLAELDRARSTPSGARIRALQSDWTLAFHETDNDQLICYSKRAPDGTRSRSWSSSTSIPSTCSTATSELPLVDWNVPPTQTIEAVDLLSDERYYWRGEWNYVRLDPQDRVAHILELHW